MRSGVAVLELIQAALETLADIASSARRRWLARHESTMWLVLIAGLLILVVILLWRGPSPFGREFRARTTGLDRFGSRTRRSLPLRRPPAVPKYAAHHEGDGPDQTRRRDERHHRRQEHADCDVPITVGMPDRRGESAVVPTSVFRHHHRPSHLASSYEHLQPFGEVSASTRCADTFPIRASFSTLPRRWVGCSSRRCAH